MRALLLLAALAFVACAPDDESDDVTVDGVDPAESDADLAPDPTLQPGNPGLAPEADVTPEPGLAPDPTVQPGSTGTPE
ncbi:hypothetical protein [Rubrivirga marina]|uniref:Uncharacterized protein n=1 Tax=Rubrivirga marina TaxID=1196024 RepID=A0A271IWF6_9BACT|nr:hypothetical protein [Rubrivirga marina]PAP75553.1 hypothetical protein BSZ37_03405 [Rubrivirga marina]